MTFHVDISLQDRIKVGRSHGATFFCTNKRFFTHLAAIWKQFEHRPKQLDKERKQCKLQISTRKKKQYEHYIFIYDDYKPFAILFGETRSHVTHYKYRAPVVTYDVGDFFPIFIEDENDTTNCTIVCTKIDSMSSWCRQILSLLSCSGRVWTKFFQVVTTSTSWCRHCWYQRMKNLPQNFFGLYFTTNTYYEYAPNVKLKPFMTISKILELELFGLLGDISNSLCSNVPKNVMSDVVV